MQSAETIIAFKRIVLFQTVFQMYHSKFAYHLNLVLKGLLPSEQQLEQQLKILRVPEETFQETLIKLILEKTKKNHALVV